jgi:TRAP-type C4-dicarboxylate transport system permease small subunit
LLAARSPARANRQNETTGIMPDDLNAPAPFATIRNIARGLARAARNLLGVLLLGMVLLNVANAACRYLFGIVLIGADELLVYGMIWIVMVGMILVTIDRRHIALDLLANRLPPRRRIALAMLHNCVVAIGCSYAALQCLEFTRRVAAIGQTSMALGFPMVYPHAALVVGLAGTALVATLLVLSDGAELAVSRGGAKNGLR